MSIKSRNTIFFGVFLTHIIFFCNMYFSIYHQVLYLGAASGTSVSHVSDVIGPVRISMVYFDSYSFLGQDVSVHYPFISSPTAQLRSCVTETVLLRCIAHLTSFVICFVASPLISPLLSLTSFCRVLFLRVLSSICVVDNI